MDLEPASVWAWASELVLASASAPALPSGWGLQSGSQLASATPQDLGWVMARAKRPAKEMDQELHLRRCH